MEESRFTDSIKGITLTASLRGISGIDVDDINSIGDGFVFNKWSR